MEMPAPVEQHQWLQQLVGEWTFESTACMGPGQPDQSFAGNEYVRPLGSYWVISDGVGEMTGGGEGLSIMSLGYDPQKGHFVGSWLGSMMPSLWVYKGELDASGKVLTLSCEGPSLDNPATSANYRDIIEIVDADHRTLRSQVQGADGQWTQFMEMRYTRA